MSDEKTIEQVKSELEVVDTSAFDTVPTPVRSSGRVTGSPVGAMSPDQFASIYPAVRGVLAALSAMWFIPSRFKTILDTLVTYLDAVTGIVPSQGDASGK